MTTTHDETAALRAQLRGAQYEIEQLREARDNAQRQLDEALIRAATKEQREREILSTAGVGIPWVHDDTFGYVVQNLAATRERHDLLQARVAELETEFASRYEAFAAARRNRDEAVRVLETLVDDARDERDTQARRAAALEAELAALNATTGWRPVTEAPGDGQECEIIITGRYVVDQPFPDGFEVRFAKKPAYSMFLRLNSAVGWRPLPSTTGE